MKPVKMKHENKKPAKAAIVTTPNSKNLIDQDRAAGATAPVADTAPSGNVPVTTGKVLTDPDTGSNDAIPAATVAAPTTAANEMINGAAAPLTPVDAAPASNVTTDGGAPAAPGTAPGDAPNTNGAHQTLEAAAMILPAVQTAPAVQPVNGRMAAADLRGHEDNEKTYGTKESTADLETSVVKYGILDPLLVTKDGRIISGHRRFRVATKLGIIEVPVRVFESEDELEIKTALLEHNRHRIKSNVQIAAEAKLMLEIESELAARRKKEAAKNGEVEILPPQKKGKARDAVGEKLGKSGRTVAKAVKMAVVIEKLKDEGKQEDAAKLETATNKGFDTGHKAAVEMGVLPKAEPKKAKKKAAGTPAKNITPPPATEDAASGVSAAPVPSKASSGKLDIDVALERADQIITFLRSAGAKTMTPQQKRDLGKMLDQINTCRASLGL